MISPLHIDADQLICISDLHLSPEVPAISQGFLDFVAQHGHDRDHDSSAFVILGDLFDTWIGDDTLNEHDQWLDSMIEALQRLSAHTPCYFIHGNRDFLIGQQFEEKTGIHCLPEIAQIQFKKHRLLLCHGDHLCTQDQDYIAFRQLVRSPQWQQEFLQQPIKERRTIAENLRRQSQQANVQKNDQILDVDRVSTTEFMNQHRASVLIHGHTHRPNIHIDCPYPRIVIGDWNPLPSWVIVTEEAVSLYIERTHERKTIRL